jgi:hypothetical protein
MEDLEPGEIPDAQSSPLNLQSSKGESLIDIKRELIRDLSSASQPTSSPRNLGLAPASAETSDADDMDISDSEINSGNILEQYSVNVQTSRFFFFWLLSLYLSLSPPFITRDPWYAFVLIAIRPWKTLGYSQFSPRGLLSFFLFLSLCAFRSYALIDPLYFYPAGSVCKTCSSEAPSA